MANNKSIYGKLLTIQSRLKSPKDKRNDHGKYAYRNAEGILLNLKPILEELNCVLVVNDHIESIGGRYYVKSSVTLIDTVSLEEVAAIGYAREADKEPMRSAAQVTGSSSSYAKKYALCNLFAIDDSRNDPDADDNTKDQSNKLNTLTAIERKHLPSEEKVHEEITNEIAKAWAKDGGTIYAIENMDCIAYSKKYYSVNSQSGLDWIMKQPKYLKS